MTEKLKPCPFCGRKPELCDMSLNKYVVTCTNKDCSFNPAEKSYCSKQKAIEAWNRRVNDE